MKDIKVNIDTSNESINKPTEVKDLHAKSKSQPNIYDVESFQLLLGERVESDKKRAFKRALDNNEHMDSDAKEVDIDEEGLLSIFGSLHMKGDMPNNMGDSLKNYSKLKTESKSKEEVTKITIDSRVESPITYEKKSISDSALDVKDSLANYSELKTESKLKEEVAKITIDSRVESPITYEKKSISDFESSNVRESISDSTLDVKNSLENYSELKTEDRKIPEIVAYLENPETVVNIVKNEKKIENLPITKSPENILTENKTEKEPEKVVLVEHQKNVPENEEEINLIERKSEYKQPQEEENKKEIETSRTEVKQNNLPTNKEGAKFSEVENDKESLDSLATNIAQSPNNLSQGIGEEILNKISNISDYGITVIAEPILKIGNEIVERLMVVNAVNSAKQEVVIVFKENVLPSTQVTLVREKSELTLSFTTTNLQSFDLLSANHDGLRNFLLEQLKDLTNIYASFDHKESHDLTQKNSQKRQQQQQDNNPNNNQNSENKSHK